jgi:hypothetical protein
MKPWALAAAASGSVRRAPNQEWQCPEESAEAATSRPHEGAPRNRPGDDPRGRGHVVRYRLSAMG